MSNQDAEPVVGSLHMRRGFAFLVDAIADGEVCVRRCRAENESQAAERFAVNDRFVVKKMKATLDVWRKEMMQP